MYWLAKYFQHYSTVCEKRFLADQWNLTCALNRFAKCLLVVLILSAALFSSVTAQAEITAQVKIEDKKNYGRIILRFFELPSYQARITDGVFILSFDETINLNTDQFMKPLGEYFTVGRTDPDGKSVRFALAKKIKLHTIEAGDLLFIDLLPQPWVGLPPSLPQKVINELSAKTQQDAEEKRQLARRAAFKKSKKTLKVRVGEYPTFSRLVFDWDKKVGVKIARSDNTLNIQFDRLIKVDITRLKVDPPKFITGAKSKLTDKGLEVDLMLGDDTNIRAFREGATYVVDVSGPLNDEEQKQRAQDTMQLPLGDKDNPATPSKKVRSEVIEFEAETPLKMPVKQAMQKSEPVVKAPAPKPVMKKQGTEAAFATITPGTLVASKILGANRGKVMPVKKQEVKKTARKSVNAPQMVVKKSTKIGGKSIAMKAKSKAEEPVPAPPKKVMAKKVTETPKVKVATAPTFKAEAEVLDKPKSPMKAANANTLLVEAKVVSGNVILNFPFEEEVPAAIFHRGDRLWVVFDTHLKLDLSALGNGHKKYNRIAGYSTITSKDSTAVVMQLGKPSLTTAAKDGTGWLLTIGDFIVTPVKPVTLISGDRADGLAKVTLNLKKPVNLHLIEDPKIGDNLAVVTAFGPPQGIIKNQRYVEFSTLSTAHGIAVKATIDDLKINVNPKNVVITREEGLLLSPSGGHKAIRSSQAGIDISRPGNINFEQWAKGGVAKFHDRRAQLEREISSQSELKYTIAPRMELARLYVGNQLGAEALGTMRILKAVNPKIENDPLFHALRGVANLMMHRLKAARFDLTSRGLARDKDTKLWLGLLEVAEGNWVQARLNFSSGESSMRNYPDKIKAQFRIKAARANIAVNDISNARYQLAAMPKVNLERKFTAEAAFLNGRILEVLARNDEALEYYKEALSYGDRMVEAETSFFKTMLEYRLGYIKSNEALDQLESQLLVWRGDEIELKVMRELAKLYVAQNSFRRGLETMRTATTYYPNEKIGRLIQDDMVALFQDLFLGEKVKIISPIQALSLYYDFRELTPIGRLGDEMIRRLSDTLISVDLLDQAAEILSHQVEKRLKGAARAQVATKLAMVHMFRRNPKKALTAIRRTRQAVLPKQVVRRRALMEASALAELGRYELAVSLLSNLEGRDVDRARASALWSGKSWQGAGEAYERFLDDAWKGSEKLSDAQRVDVLRAAISYTLADDRIGTERLAKNFAPKMLTSSDAQTFRVITSSNGGREAQFRDIARQIASIDTLRGFLEEFRKAELPLTSDPASVPQS